MFRNIAMTNMPRNLLLIALVAILLVLPVTTAGLRGDLLKPLPWYQAINIEAQE